MTSLNWPAGHFPVLVFSCLVLLLGCVLLFGVVCLLVFAFLFRLPCGHLESDGSLGYVSVRASLTLVKSMH